MHGPLQDADDAEQRANRWEVRTLVGLRQAVADYDRMEGEFKLRKHMDAEDGISPAAVKMMVNVERGYKDRPLGSARRRVVAWECLHSRAEKRARRMRQFTYHAARGY